MEEMSGQQQKEARDKLKDDIKKSVRDAAKRQGLSDEEKKIMKGIGLDRVTDIPEVSKGQWNKALNRILSNALSIKSTYNPNRPSRRIPDAFGSSTIEKDIKDIVLALDCSGSMGAPQFKESIRHIQTFLNSLRGVNPKFHLILWGGSPDALEYVRIPHKDDVAKTMMSKGGQRNWGTDPQYMFQYIMDNIWNKPDAVIIFTDGQFWSEPTREIESYIRRNQDRLVWVLTSNGTIRNAKKFDPTVEMLPRYIKQGKG
jgi:predicted metal-dependent peptidase